jgi:hypothetical protein
MSLENQHLEAKLRQALRRQDPPGGFAERVVLLNRNRKGASVRSTPRPRFRLLWPAATFAATAALILSISIEYHAVQEERAGRQAIQALQIASQELNMARDKVLSQ